MKERKNVLKVIYVRFELNKRNVKEFGQNQSEMGEKTKPQKTLSCSCIFFSCFVCVLKLFQKKREKENEAQTKYCNQKSDHNEIGIIN